MAYYGLSHPVIAERDETDSSAITYKNGFYCGKAVETSVTANSNEASLYGDDVLAEFVTEFKDADVTMGVTTLPNDAVTVMFGHSIDSETNEIQYNASDSPKYVGYGFYASEMIGGVKKYIACWLPKVKFGEPSESYQTRGDSITFNTPSLSGKATVDEDNNWRYKKVFDTEDAALSYLKSKAGL